MDNDYFKKDNQLYKQIYSLTMGNPLSPIVAYINMGCFQNKFNDITKKKPNTLMKYFDDLYHIIKEKNRKFL